jgi:hypothetical protein
MEVLCASEATDWIVLKEATCETQREAVHEKQTWDVPSEPSVQGSTIADSESTRTSSDSMDSEVASVTTDKCVREDLLQDDLQGIELFVA